MTRPISIIAISLVLFGLGTASCGGEVDPLGPGALSVSWQVSPRGCDDAGVDVVEVNLDGVEPRSETFDCGAKGALIDDLEPGVYRMRIEGLDDGGDAIFAAPRARVVVHADVLTEADHARLTAKPARMIVTWLFANGRVCGSNGVDDVEIAVFDKADYEIARERFACDAGSGNIDGFTAGTYVVEAVGLSDGRPSHRGLETVGVERGEEIEFEVVLEHD